MDYGRSKVPTFANGLASGARRMRNVVNLILNLVAQVIPNVVWHLEKHLYYFGIKLAPSPFRNFLTRSAQRLLWSINSIGGDGIQRIGDREDASPKGNFFTFQTSRIASTV